MKEEYGVAHPWGQKFGVAGPMSARQRNGKPRIGAEFSAEDAAAPWL